MNFDTWVQLHEASRISSEPILQRYFETPTEFREPTEEDQRDLRLTYGRRVESLDADEAATEREQEAHRERNRRRYQRQRQMRDDLEFNGRTIAGDEPVPEAS